MLNKYKNIDYSQRLCMAGEAEVFVDVFYFNNIEVYLDCQRRKCEKPFRYVHNPSY